jgi:hypothetical protein
MNHFVHAILTCAVILTFYGIWGLFRESRTVRKRFKQLADYLDRNPYGIGTMQDVTYKLYRRTKPTRDPGVVHDSHLPAIVSTMEVIATTSDPFACRLALQAEYPGWAIGSDFETATDREYAEMEFDSYPEELDSGDE